MVVICEMRVRWRIHNGAAVVWPAIRHASFAEVIHFDDNGMFLCSISIDNLLINVNYLLPSNCHFQLSWICLGDILVPSLSECGVMVKLPIEHCDAPPIRIHSDRPFPRLTN